MNLLQNKKLVITCLILFTSIIIVRTYTIFKTPIKQAPALPTPIPTPTLIPLPPSAFQNTTLSAFAPIDGSQNVSPFATVSATFSRPLSPAEIAHVSLTLSSPAEGVFSWSSDSQTVFFTPKRLTINTTYQARISFGSLTNTWLFTTASDATLSQEDKKTLQLQSDDNFGQWQNQLYSTYPWYDNLPLIAYNYFTYFDIDKKAFISDIYTDPKNKAQIEAIKQEIMGKLRALGIDTAAYHLVWNINPGSE